MVGSDVEVVSTEATSVESIKVDGKSFDSIPTVASFINCSWSVVADADSFNSTLVASFPLGLR